VVDQPDQLLDEVDNLFTIAETKIKQVELLREEIIIPAVNQLRYAGHHILKSLKTAGAREKESQLEQAKSHCERAICDSMEIGIAYCLERINAFKNDYKAITITDVIPTYFGILCHARAAQELIVQGVEANNREPDQKRYANHNEMSKYFDLLRDDVNALDVGREELNKKVIRYRRNLILSIAGLTLAAFTLAATVLAISH